MAKDKAHAASVGGNVVAKINPDLLTLAKPLDSLRLDERNARKHGKRDLEVLAKSLDTHGQQKTIVVLADGKVIAGNGTILAARSLGWTHLACVTFDNEDAARAAAFAIVDNRSAELSEWDFNILASELEALAVIPDVVIGFTDAEKKGLMATLAWEGVGIDSPSDDKKPRERMKVFKFVVVDPSRFAEFKRGYAALLDSFAGAIEER